MFSLNLIIQTLNLVEDQVVAQVVAQIVVQVVAPKPAPACPPLTFPSTRFKYNSYEPREALSSPAPQLLCPQIRAESSLPSFSQTCTHQVTMCRTLLPLPYQAV